MEAVVNYKQPIFSGISFLILLNQRSSLYRSCINWDYWGMSNFASGNSLLTLARNLLSW